MVISGICLLCVLPVSGAVLRVGHSPGYDYTTITAALDAANAGDTVTVAPGVYRRNDPNYWETFPLIMKSGVVLIRESKDAYPEINADRAAQVFKCEYTDEGTRIEGFVITGGDAHGGLEFGGGLFLGNGFLSLSSCEIRDCEADDDGGGLFCSYATVTIDQCRFISNSADNGGGLSVGSGSSLQMSDTEITDNQADIHGGGIAVFVNSQLDMSRCELSGNSADQYAGALYAENSTCSLTNCMISGNTAQQNGGGLSGIYTDVNLIECLFMDNDTLTGGGAVSIISGSTLKIQNSLLYRNTASEYGAGVHCKESEVDVLFSRIQENTASLGGGGLYFMDAGGTLVTCDLTGNHSSAGAGLYCDQSDVGVANCLFTENVAEEFGGGIYCNNAAPTVRSCTMTGNTAWDGGGAVSCYNALPVLTDCIFWNNTITEISWSGTAPDVTYSDVQGSFSGTGNINADPLFAASSEGDYFLSQTASGQNERSPCINTGSAPSLSIAFTGCDETFYMDQFTTRTDMQTDTGTVDMGYHYHPTRPACRRLGCTVDMPSHDFGPGDTCSCDVTLCNPDPVKYEVMPVFVLLDIYGAYFFAPSFSPYDHYTLDIFYGQTMISVLPAFPWPTGTGDAQGLWFHACITNHAVTEIVGVLDSFQFEYHD